MRSTRETVCDDLDVQLVGLAPHDPRVESAWPMERGRSRFDAPSRVVVVGSDDVAVPPIAIRDRSSAMGPLPPGPDALTLRLHSIHLLGTAAFLPIPTYGRQARSGGLVRLALLQAGEFAVAHVACP